MNYVNFKFQTFCKIKTNAYTLSSIPNLLAIPYLLANQCAKFQVHRIIKTIQKDVWHIDQHNKNVLMRRIYLKYNKNCGT